MKRPVQKMKSVYELMRAVAMLKEVKRTGWNKKFPPGHHYASRSVRNAESSADHSFGCLMLALFLATELGVDPFKLICMMAVHDLVEFEGKDWITITETGAKLVRAKRLKQQAEQRAMNKIGQIGGISGRKINALWKEYEENKTPEAQIAHQLDKLEACFQAVHYYRRGDKLDPMEFVSNGLQMVTHPKLRYLISRLKRECQQLKK